MIISRIRRIASRAWWAVPLAVWAIGDGLSQFPDQQRGASVSGRFPVWAAVSACAEPTPPQDDDPPDASKIMGPQACVECHESQVRAWMNSQHARTDERLKSDAAFQYAEKLQIPPDRLVNDSICTRCHASVQQDATGEPHAIAGVSCERCHGPSGGETGWLKPHAVFGPEGTQPDEETPAHRQERIAYCEEQGMIRPANGYKLAKRCFQCHIVADEDLVKAGHKAGSAGFELVSWIAGEVRHNFHVDQQINAPAPTLWMKQTGRTAAQRKRVLFVLGVLVDLETSLRNRSRATTNIYASQMGARVGALKGKLSQINAAVEIPQTRKAAEVINRVFSRLFVRQKPGNAFFGKAADEVAAAAKALTENYDGRQLAPLDPLIAANKPVGTPYQP